MLGSYAAYALPTDHVRAAGSKLRVSSGDSIQCAVDRAPAGGIVSVEPGVYKETVIIDKPLTLQSTGGPEVTLIQADRQQFAYKEKPIDDMIVGAINVVGAPDVLVEGFAVTGGLEGVWVSTAQDSLIRSCSAFGNDSSGYYVWRSQNVDIVRSVGYDNAVGAYEGQSYHVSMRECGFFANRGGIAPHLGYQGLEFPGVGILSGNVSTGGDIVGCRCVANAHIGIQVNVRVRSKSITNCLISANPVGLFLGERVKEVHHNNIMGNSDWGLQTYLEIDARENWWGHPSGPSGAGPGRGDAVMETANFTPWLDRPVDLSPFVI